MAVAMTQVVAPVSAGPSSMSSLVEIDAGVTATFCLFAQPGNAVGMSTGQLYMETPGDPHLIADFGASPVQVTGPARVMVMVSKVPVGKMVGIASYR